MWSMCAEAEETMEKAWVDQGLATSNPIPSGETKGEAVKAFLSFKLNASV